MAEYFYRYAKDAPTRPLLVNDSNETFTSEKYGQHPMELCMKLLVLSVCVETLFLFVRAVYRTIKLTQGFHGRIIETQIYFNILDGTMVILAIYSVNFFHPARLLHEINMRHLSKGLASKNTVPSATV